MFGAASGRHPPGCSHGVWLDGSGVVLWAVSSVVLCEIGLGLITWSRTKVVNVT